MAEIYEIVQRTENYDEVVSWWETKEEAEKEKDKRQAFFASKGSSDKFFVKAKKVFGLNPE